MLNWDLVKERNVKVWAHTHTQRLDDATRLHSAQHDVQENTSETNDLHFSIRKRKTN